MIQNIQIIDVMCDKQGHQDQHLTSLCIGQLCKTRSVCCHKCAQDFHQDCGIQIIFFDEVPKMIGTIQKLEKVYKNFVSRINEVMKQIKEALDGLLKPIQEYQDSPNLTNLNRLGQLLRVNQKITITQFIELAENTISDEINKLLQKLQITLLKNLIDEPTQAQQDEAAKLSDKAQKLVWRNSIESLDCIEKAILLVPNNEKYLNQKGLCLEGLHRLEEAIESCNKSISIKPNVDSYYDKARYLSKLNKIDLAIDCCKQGLAIFPNEPSLTNNLNSYKSELNQD